MNRRVNEARVIRLVYSIGKCDSFGLSGYYSGFHPVYKSFHDGSINNLTINKRLISVKNCFHRFRFARNNMFTLEILDV